MRHKALIILSILSTACGSDPRTESKQVPDTKDTPSQEQTDTTSQREEAYHSYSISSRSALGVCDEKKLNHLYYIRDEKSLVSCDGKTWEDLALEDKEDPNLWHDEYSGLTWHFMGFVSGHPYISNVDQKTKCDANSLTTPTESDIKGMIEGGAWLHYSWIEPQTTKMMALDDDADYTFYFIDAVTLERSQALSRNNQWNNPMGLFCYE